MRKGLIVSIQNYSNHVTLELASTALNNGAIAIRTDIDISMIIKAAFPHFPLIGLKKIADKKYYITTSKEAINSCLWADYIAIDSRRGNSELDFLYGLCYYKKKNIVADVKDIKDVEQICNLIEKNKIKSPAYIATTFAFDKLFNDKINDINEIKKMTDIPIIAEGGYRIIDIRYLDVDNICIGKDISGIGEKTKEATIAFNRTA